MSTVIVQKLLSHEYEGTSAFGQCLRVLVARLCLSPFCSSHVYRVVQERSTSKRSPRDYRRNDCLAELVEDRDYCKLARFLTKNSA